ncbi:probable ATP-dependent RNA helicase Dbp73D [Phlebotomus argentipes]|uniref:probable ATP-dependent RNA helicase Dbp73D n=1 Tax=Phlebotomus argentipes TaxID=94469 RepID=UPI002892FE11|nr:probable ATP-dependent RNA helicase Dbp73D [Phlebotomus argentipes]
MELFDVKRYAPGQKQADPGRENRLLEKLQGIIAEKKKILEEKQEKHKEPSVEKDQPAEHEIEESEEEETVIQTPGETFKILGDEQFAEKEKVKRTLPSWLSHPVVISNDLTQKTERIDDMPFLSPEMRENLKKMGIETLFPVQKQVIPWILDAHANPPPFRPRDICVSAPTGSGKTIAFALPIIQLLMQRTTQKIRALVVLPVRELAAQVFTVFKNLSKGTNLNCLLFSPNRSFAEEQKYLVKEVNGKMHSRVDIIVTTAGRLVEHLCGTPGFCLKDLKFLVIDEADRIMEQIQNDWLYHLENHLQKDVQHFPGRNIPVSLMTLKGELAKQPHKLLFSATLSSDPEKLENMKLFLPKLFTSVATEFKYTEGNQEASKELVGKFTTPAELTEKICETEMEKKPLTLFKLITENSWRRFLCFTNNNIAANRLTFVLQKMLGDGLVVKDLSANLKKNARMAILSKFAAGKVHGLVSSDALARGIDLPNVDVVVSYDCPRHIRTYIHRIGRTARAGRPGTAVTLISQEDREMFKKILTTAGKSPLQDIKVSSESHEEKFSSVLVELNKYLKDEKKRMSVRTQKDENTMKKPALKRKKVDPEPGKLKRKKKRLPGKEIRAKKAKIN